MPKPISKNKKSSSALSGFLKWTGLALLTASLWVLIATGGISGNTLPLITAAAILTAVIVLRILYLLNFARISRSGSNALVDELDGIEFERFCAAVLKKNGFRNVHVTKSSGDFGADITAIDLSNGIWVFQCKRYASNVGNSPVQEVTAAKLHYNAQYAAVITNRHFTPAARQLAEENDVVLIEREKLLQMNKKPSRHNCRKLRKIAAPSPAPKRSGKIGGIIILDDRLDD